MAQGDDVASLGHGHPQHDHWLTLVMHLHTGGVDGAAANGGDIPQAQLLTRGSSDGHQAEIVNCSELSGNTDLHHLEVGVDRTRPLHRVLLAQLRQHAIQIQAEL